MTTAIDLSRLQRPEVPGLRLTLDAAHAEILQWLETVHGWTVTESAADPAYRLTRLVAGREVLLRQAVSDAMAQTSLAYADGDNLDGIGATYYTLARLEGETDDAYRQRLAGAFERYAVGLSGPWYESVARGVPGVTDARVTSPTPGAVTISVLADETLTTDTGEARYPNGIPDPALLDGVTAVVTAPETRQQTDRVTVSAATRVPYDVTVTLTLFAEPDSALVHEAATARLVALAGRAARLGGAISTVLISGATVDPAAVETAAVTLHRVDPAVRARLTLGAGNAAVTLTAATPGAAGSQITAALVDPGATDQALAVAVNGTALTVTLATDAARALTTTAAALVAAWAASTAATRLATCTLADGSDGTGVLAATSATPLAGGRDLRAVPADDLTAGDGAAPQARTLTVETQ